MMRKLIYFGTLERIKIYIGILIVYVLFYLVSSISGPNFWVEIFPGAYIDVSSMLLLGIALTALVLMNVILFVRDFYSPTAYLLFSLPVNGSAVVASRLVLFFQDIFLLLILDLPARVPMVRTLLSAIPEDIGNEVILPTASELVWPSIIYSVAGILVCISVPLIIYFLISSAKCIFDLNSSWLAIYVTGVCAGLFLLGMLVSNSVPELVNLYQSSDQSYAMTANYSLLFLLVFINGIFFWAGSWVIDRKLNI